ANTALWLDGNVVYGYSQLFIDQDSSNHGIIRLDCTSNDGNDRGDYLSIAGTLTNAADGRIEALADQGDNRVMSGNMVNAGHLVAHTFLTIGSGGAILLNTGIVQLDNTTLTLIGSTVTNELGGIVGGSGTVAADNITVINRGVIDVSPPSVYD